MAIIATSYLFCLNKKIVIHISWLALPCPFSFQTQGESQKTLGSIAFYLYHWGTHWLPLLQVKGRPTRRGSTHSHKPDRGITADGGLWPVPQKRPPRLEEANMEGNCPEHPSRGHVSDWQRSLPLKLHVDKDRETRRRRHDDKTRSVTNIVKRKNKIIFSCKLRKRCGAKSTQMEEKTTTRKS